MPPLKNQRNIDKRRSRIDIDDLIVTARKTSVARDDEQVELAEKIIEIAMRYRDQILVLYPTSKTLKG